MKPIEDLERPAEHRWTGECPACWELVAAVLEPVADTATGVVNPVRVAKEHPRPAAGGGVCIGSGQPVERLA